MWRKARMTRTLAMKETKAEVRKTWDFFLAALKFQEIQGLMENNKAKKRAIRATATMAVTRVSKKANVSNEILGDSVASRG